jgi:hypothetical protein
MIGDGAIAESIVSFNITWNNPGKGKQPEWNQNLQTIELHSVELYPDLLYTKATGLATYFKHTTVDKILAIIAEINSVIDSKLANQIKESVNATTASNSPASASATPASQSNLPNEKPSTGEPAKPEELSTSDLAYSVEVIGSRLKLIDVQKRGAGYTEVQIIHKVSDNMIKGHNDDSNFNSQKISVIVRLDEFFGEKFEFSYSDFDTENGINLLVEVLPSIELRFTPSEEAVAPRSEATQDTDQWLVDLRYLTKGTQIEKEVEAAEQFEKAKASQNK